MQHKTLKILIPDAETYDALKILRCLGQDKLIKTYLLSNSRFAAARFSRYRRRFHYYSSAKYDNGWIDAIEDIVRKQKVDVVLPTTDRGVEILVRYHERLSEIVTLPPLPKLDVYRMVRNKWLFYKHAKKGGLPVIPTTFLNNKNGRIPNFDSITYPVLLKPTSSRGGYGIVKINNSAEIMTLWSNEIKKQTDHDYILQNYIPGKDYCLGILALNGEILAYTIQKEIVSSSDRFGPQRAMEFVNNNQILEIGKRLVNIFNWEGIAFIDFRFDDKEKKYRLIELNPRFGQAVLGSLAAGVNFPVLTSLAVLGKDWPNPKYNTIKYIHPKAAVQLLISKLFNCQKNIKFTRNESGLSFFFKDPIPEIIYVVNILMRKFIKSNKHD